jgi:hypothetical protein
MSINWLVFIAETGSVLCEVATEIQNMFIHEIYVANHAFVASHRTSTAEARVHSSANPY